MVECEKGFVEGEIIAIHLVGFGNHMAEVKWSIGRRAGAEFMRYLEIQEYQICLDLMAGAGNA